MLPRDRVPVMDRPDGRPRDGYERALREAIEHSLRGQWLDAADAALVAVAERPKDPVAFRVLRTVHGRIRAGRVLWISGGPGLRSLATMAPRPKPVMRAAVAYGNVLLSVLLAFLLLTSAPSVGGTWAYLTNTQTLSGSTIRTVDLTPPTPTLGSVDGTTGAVTINWTRGTTPGNPTDTVYQVYERKAPAGTYTYLTTTVAPALTYTTGARSDSTYYYALVATKPGTTWGGPFGTALQVKVGIATPTVVSVSPANGSTAVSASTTIDVQFSEPMTTADVQAAFSLKPCADQNCLDAGLGSAVAGTFAWSQSSAHLAFTPGTTLTNSTSASTGWYKVIVGTGADDQDSTPKPLASAVTSSFQVGSSSSMVLTASPSRAVFAPRDTQSTAFTVTTDASVNSVKLTIPTTVGGVSTASDSGCLIAFTGTRTWTWTWLGKAGSDNAGAYVDDGDYAYTVTGYSNNDCTTTDTYSSVVVTSDSAASLWRLGDVATTTAANAVGTGPSGTYTNGVSLNQTGALINDSNKAASFDGVDDYIDISNTAAVDITGTGAANQVETATIAGTVTSGVAQVETSTVAGTVSGDGALQVTVTAAGMTNSPKAVAVAVVTTDTSSDIATKIRTALGADGDVSAFFTVSGTGADVVLTALMTAVNDATMNIAIAQTTATGFTAQPTSADTTAGVSPGNAQVVVTAAGMTNSPKTVTFAVATGDTATNVATKARTALSAVTDVSAFFTVSGAGANVVLTAKETAANDATMNVASACGTCTGLTAAPTSADTTAGAAGTGVITLEAWVNPSGTTGTRYILARGSGTATSQRQYGLYLAAGTNNVGFELRAGRTYFTSEHGSVSAGVWSHIVVTYDGTSMKWYVNGTQVGTETTLSGALNSQSADLLIGASAGAGPQNYFAGLLDEVALYSTALSAAQVKYHYVVGQQAYALGGQRISVLNGSSINVSPDPFTVTLSGTPGSNTAKQCITATVYDSRGQVLSDGATVRFKFNSGGNGTFRLTGSVTAGGNPTTTQDTEVSSTIGAAIGSSCAAVTSAGKAQALLEMVTSATTTVTVTALAVGPSGTDVTSQTSVNDPPDAPSDLELSPGSIKAKFKPSTRATAAGYFVLIGTSPGSYSRKLDIKDATSAHIEDGIQPGTRYYVAVQAYDKLGQTSSPSSEASIIAPPDTPIARIAMEAGPLEAGHALKDGAVIAGTALDRNGRAAGGASITFSAPLGVSLSPSAGQAGEDGTVTTRVTITNPNLTGITVSATSGGASGSINLDLLALPQLSVTPTALMTPTAALTVSASPAASSTPGASGTPTVASNVGTPAASATVGSGTPATGSVAGSAGGATAASGAPGATGTPAATASGVATTAPAGTVLPGVSVTTSPGPSAPTAAPTGTAASTGSTRGGIASGTPQSAGTSQPTAAATSAVGAGATSAPATSVPATSIPATSVPVAPAATSAPAATNAPAAGSTTGSTTGTTGSSTGSTTSSSGTTSSTSGSTSSTSGGSGSAALSGGVGATGGSSTSSDTTSTTLSGSTSGSAPGAALSGGATGGATVSGGR